MSNVQLNSFEDILSYASADFSEVRAWLVQQIDYLFHHDMEKLKWVLYRIDVNELKLKQLLIDNPEVQPAEIIADEIIKRQIQKYHSRKATEAADWSFDI